MRHAAIAALVTLTGCSRDIQLGIIPTDAPRIPISDSSTSPFTPGPYHVSFLDPNLPACMGTLAGRESDFASVTRADVGLVDGQLQLAIGPDQLTVSGAPIQTAYARSSVLLVPDPNGPLWAGQVNGDFGAGPDATSAISLLFGLDSQTANAPGGVQGAYARGYATNDSQGTCTVTFGALLVRN